MNSEKFSNEKIKNCLTINLLNNNKINIKFINKIKSEISEFIHKSNLSYHWALQNNIFDRINLSDFVFKSY
jgi:hypothetical protein